jgi:hypothetical protein
VQSSSVDSSAASTAILLIDHRGLRETMCAIERWMRVVPESNVVLGYGGDATTFRDIPYERKLFIKDPRLRTKDHQRERQSWIGGLPPLFEWMRSNSAIEFVHVVEFDHLPVVDDLVPRLVARLQQERADVLAYRLHRIDGTNHPHFLGHVEDRAFNEYFAKVSCRRDRTVILSMLATGSFWRRGALELVANRPEPFPIYGELYFPTLAHHLGLRVRDMKEQNRFVTHAPNLLPSERRCRAGDAWAIHPIKRQSIASSKGL